MQADAKSAGALQTLKAQTENPNPKIDNGLPQVQTAAQGDLMAMPRPAPSGDKPAADFAGVWCRRWESNPHGFPHTSLSRARLPVPPLRRDPKYSGLVGFSSNFVKYCQPTGRPNWAGSARGLLCIIPAFAGGRCQSKRQNLTTSPRLGDDLRTGTFPVPGCQSPGRRQK